MARRFAFDLEFTGMSQANRAASATILPSCEAVCLLFALQSFLVQNFALWRGLLEAFNPGIRRGNERSRSLSCLDALASKIKTILELEADRRRNHPDGSRGISVSRPGSSIVGNGGIGGRSPRQ